MATAAVAAPSHIPQRQQRRRAPTPHAPTVPVQYPLTGFVRIEDGSAHAANAALNNAAAAPHKSVASAKALTAAASSKHKHSTSTAATNRKGCSRWLYGVLLPGKLQLYARRTDYKRNIAPSDEIHMLVRAPSANESVFGFDHECVYIRCQRTGQIVTVRIHQKKEIVRWVTALYYQSCNSSDRSPPAASSKHDSERPPVTASTNAVPVATDAAPLKRKSVSFHDEPDVLLLPRASFDPAELFYSEREYEQFQQRSSFHAAANGDDDEDEDDGDCAANRNSSSNKPTDASARASAATAPPPKKKNLSRLMKSIYAKTAAKLKVSHKRDSIEQRR